MADSEGLVMSRTVDAESIPYAKCSITGMVREINEDSVFTGSFGNDPDSVILAVADGMGGHQRGEWASQTTITAVSELVSGAGTDDVVEDILLKATALANMRVREGASGIAPPGSTLSIAVVKDNAVTIVNVGDSRVYVLRNGHLLQLTVDDTLAETLVRSGMMDASEAQTSDESHMLVESIGRADEIDPTVSSHELRKGDLILVCSDGLYNMVSDESIAFLISQEKSPNQAVSSLCEAANRAGGLDNISVAIYSHGPWAVKAMRSPRTQQVKHKTIPWPDQENQTERPVPKRSGSHLQLLSIITIILVLLAISISLWSWIGPSGSQDLQVDPGDKPGMHGVDKNSPIKQNTDS